MKILFVASEFSDFAKAGGLADVSATLPRALRKLGLDVRVLLPGYQKVLDHLDTLGLVGTLPHRAGVGPCLLAEARTRDGLSLYVLLDPSLYQREGNAYLAPSGQDWPDNDLRFARLALAAAQIAKGSAGLSWRPDLVHVNDWPGGLAPAYMRWEKAEIPSLMTVHNLAYQGVFEAGRRETLGIPEEDFSIDGVEFYDKISFLKAGLFYADAVTTVSPTYAREITTPQQGAGLHGLLAGRAAQGTLRGILNGLGEGWEPNEDPCLPKPFSIDEPAGKVAAKDLIRMALCLAPSEGPLFGIVSRLVHQKGMDLVAEIAPEIVERGGQIAILGVGDPETEENLRGVMRRHRDNMAMLNGFNEPMARRIMAASDFHLMPSRFEPCGLSQLHAQRYGALPLAHATGGLIDTIEDGETGFLFEGFRADSFLGAVARAFDAFADPVTLARMRRAAMSRNFDWTTSAAEYAKLYASLTGKPFLRLAAETAPRLGTGPGELRTASFREMP